MRIKDLEKTINRVPCDVVIDGTPINLEKLIDVKKPIVTVDYVLDEKGKSVPARVVDRLVKLKKVKKR